MMFLSRVPLNPARAGTRKLLASPQVAHAAVLAAFPPAPAPADDTAGRVLWRIDRSDHQIDLYVVSPTEPDFTHVVEQAGWPTTTAWTTRKYTPLLDQLAPGQHWHFRLTANPTRARVDPTAHGPAGRGKRNGLTLEAQHRWLAERADTSGFTLPTGAHGLPDTLITDRTTLRFRRGPATVTVSTATYEGTLTVTDPEALRHRLTHGIGRAKGYGCGLLTLAPIP